ncbi:hypothetical protein [Prescottella sp. R16]|uniref:hypothetical protein n=1 Tax=Prescottella sp. R16 TaxID=3064529 RepID=UPI00272E1CB9|nr:hypothetical protein [Prescottella sp. R16]
MTLISALLLVVGTIGALGSIVFGAALVGQWTMALTVIFVAIAATGALLIKPRR